MNSQSKPLVWLHGEVKTPSSSHGKRIEAGVLPKRLQEGESLVPHSRPMPSIGTHCHKLRIRGEAVLVEIKLALSRSLKERRQKLMT